MKLISCRKLMHIYSNQVKVDYNNIKEHETKKSYRLRFGRVAIGGKCHFIRQLVRLLVPHITLCGFSLDVLSVFGLLGWIFIKKWSDNLWYRRSINVNASCSITSELINTPGFEPNVIVKSFYICLSERTVYYYNVTLTERNNRAHVARPRDLNTV